MSYEKGIEILKSLYAKVSFLGYPFKWYSGDDPGFEPNFCVCNKQGYVLFYVGLCRLQKSGWNVYIDLTYIRDAKEEFEKPVPVSDLLTGEISEWEIAGNIVELYTGVIENPIYNL